MNNVLFQDTLRLKIHRAKSLCTCKKNCIFYRNVIPGMSATQDGIQRASASNVLFFLGYYSHRIFIIIHMLHTSIMRIGDMFNMQDRALKLGYKFYR